MKLLFSLDYTVTKRQLGAILAAAGAAALLLTLGLEWVRADGFGTTQKMTLLVSAACLLVGLTLLPLGDRPA